MIKLEFDSVYLSGYRELVIIDPEIKSEIERRVSWFGHNLDDTRLDNHELKRKMKGRNVFSITGDIRIVYKWLGKKQSPFFGYWWLSKGI